jgi:MFS family permease
MTVLGCAFALTGSQIAPLLYLTLGTSIAAQLGRSDLVLWMLTAMIVAVGAMAPFVGPLADLFGRKIIFVVCLLVSIVGSIVCSTTPTAGGFIAGQLLLGVGAVSQELLAIAVVAEIVPTAQRAMYGAIILSAIIPWSPGTLYAQYMASSNWRWVGCALALWNLVTLILIAVFYRPPPRVNAKGLTKREMFNRIDFFGGFLLVAGSLMFLVGLDSGGINFPWRSAKIISLLTVGGLLMIAFGFWEKFGAKYPLFPRRIVHAPRPFYCMMYVIFAAGINYIPVVVFWPIESISVFNSNHKETGINTLVIGMGILGGAMVSAVMLGLFRRHVMWVMTFFVVIQTVGKCALK